MSNIERAVEIIFATEKRVQGHTYDLDVAKVRAYLLALDHAGLLIPDLPAPDIDHRDPEHCAEYKAFWEGPVLDVWNTNLPGDFTVQVFPDRPEVQMYEDGEPMEPFSPEEARRLAHVLLAAANQAEEEA